MDFVSTIIQFIASGGPSAIIAILVGVIAFLVWERKKLVSTVNDTFQLVYDTKDSESKSIKDIIERYHTGNVNLVQALNEIKIVLTSIQIQQR